MRPQRALHVHGRVHPAAHFPEEVARFCSHTKVLQFGITMTYSTTLDWWSVVLPPRRGGRRLARGERFLRTPGNRTNQRTPPWKGGRTRIQSGISFDQSSANKSDRSFRGGVC